VPLTMGLSQVARAAFFGVSPFAPGALAVSVAVVAAIVLLAAYVPARRATRLDPATALRN
jgi:ABC-type antimicrobial peptide transport system permease subunit